MHLTSQALRTADLSKERFSEDPPFSHIGNSSIVKIFIIRPKPEPVAKNATPRPSGWESNPELH